MTSFFRRLSLKPGRKAVPESGTDGTQTLPQADEQVEPLPISTPKTQTVLLLLAAKQPYQLTEKYDVPELHGEHEVLVRTHAIGLNPIDWKAP